jgi:hypothetical protein
MSRTTDFLKRELKAVALVTAYFLSWFSVIGYIKTLMLAQYNVSFVAVGSALVGSLVIAKVVVILDETSVGDRFSKQAALIHILWRSLIYTFFVAIVMVLEKIVEGMFDGQAIAEAARNVWLHRNRDHILVSVILISIAFLFYNTFAVVNRALGKKGLVGVLRSPLAEEWPD